jgi:hypothetical protein
MDGLMKVNLERWAGYRERTMVIAAMIVDLHEELEEIDRVQCWAVNEKLEGAAVELWECLEEIRTLERTSVVLIGLLGRRQSEPS